MGSTRWQAHPAKHAQAAASTQSLGHPPTQPPTLLSSTFRALAASAAAMSAAAALACAMLGLPPGPRLLSTPVASCLVLLRSLSSTSTRFSMRCGWWYTHAAVSWLRQSQQDSGWLGEGLGLRNKRQAREHHTPSSMCIGCVGGCMADEVAGA